MFSLSAELGNLWCPGEDSNFHDR